MSARGLSAHRPGPFKQQNKSHKHGRHRSNRAIDVANKGRVSIKILTKKAKRDLKKCDRRNQVQQIRKKKRDEMLAKKRLLGGQGTPPFLVAIIPLCSAEDPWKLLQLIKSCDDEAVIKTCHQDYCHISIPRFKQRFTFVIPKPGDLYGILDAAKIADTLMFIYSIDDVNDEIGEQILMTLFAQGLPSTVHVVQNIEKVPIKKRSDLKKNIITILEKRFPDEKLFTVDKAQDALLVLRHIGCQKQRKLVFRDRQSHLLAEVLSFEPYPDSNDFEEYNTKGVLKATGFIRGQPLDVNKLIHIPGWGDFQVSQIDSCAEPVLVQQKTKKNEEMDDNVEKVVTLEITDKTKQESLQSENIPDPMEGEQTWPTEEEIALVEKLQESKTVMKKVPKGMSAYQAAWIVESDEEDKDDEFDYDDDFSDDENNKIDHDISYEMDANESEVMDSASQKEDGEQEYDSVTVTEAGDPHSYDEKMNVDEENAMMVKFREQRMDQMFPDEMDTPLDTPAKVRFARYRGLKSFHSSPWDPKENLPSEYARIFQFENFTRTKKRILSEDKFGIMPGRYVTLHISDVPKQLFDSYNKQHPMALYGLLPHEQKMSVINMVLKKHSSYNDPIKSKEPLVFHVGYRRFEACPIFSIHSNSNKHKYERFLKSDVAVVASVYAPIIIPPASVLVFKKGEDGFEKLVATGLVLSVDPNRLVIKRVVLSGHPFKINRKAAVVRYMFFNRDDILWFKPVELHTKLGRRGHIKEPLGTHGHMKCIFDKQLMSQDTVLMNLYKRVFPKWTYNKYIEDPPPLYDPTMYEIEMQ